MSKSSLKKAQRAARQAEITKAELARNACAIGIADSAEASAVPVAAEVPRPMTVVDSCPAPEITPASDGAHSGSAALKQDAGVQVAEAETVPKPVQPVQGQPRALPVRAPKPVPHAPTRVSFDTWMNVSSAIAGPKHYRAAQPGQDFAASTLHPRPVAISCDGKGSGSLSQFGSRAICEKTLELVDTLDYVLRDFLDAEPHDPDFSQRAIMSALTRSWAGTIAHLALQHHAKPGDLETTLNAAVIGRVYTLLLQVGDGAVVGLCPHPAMEARRLLEPSRGEYAGQTKFIGAKPLTPQDLTFRLARTSDWSGFACMSDGVTDLLVRDADGRADGVAQIAAGMEGPSRSQDLAHFLTDGDTWPARFQDDRSIALVWDSCRSI